MKTHFAPKLFWSKSPCGKGPTNVMRCGDLRRVTCKKCRAIRAALSKASKGE